ncbi:hypothetical protein HZ326_29831 [Fusarium oxysporum f. sp. albedinis]|nr:hypothetical protein HZ326_29831 [Fusarium oxysporum f. sp. albedinis]
MPTGTRENFGATVLDLEQISLSRKSLLCRRRLLDRGLWHSKQRDLGSGISIWDLLSLRAVAKDFRYVFEGSKEVGELRADKELMYRDI